MFASLHLWVAKLNEPYVHAQPDADDCWHLVATTKSPGGTFTATGSKDELRAYVAALAEHVEAIPERVEVAA